MTSRPAVSDVSDQETLLRWYWLRDELVVIARRLGVGVHCGKVELTARIAAHLSRLPPPSEDPVAVRHDRLPATLTGDTVIEPGQRCTQALREWLAARVGEALRFDGPMRTAVSEGGITLDGLVGVWRATRRRSDDDIAPQFEFNRFSRQWHSEHPGGLREDMLRVWRAHRDAPRDGYGVISSR